MRGTVGPEFRRAGGSFQNPAAITVELHFGFGGVDLSVCKAIPDDTMGARFTAFAQRFAAGAADDIGTETLQSRCIGPFDSQALIKYQRHDERFS